MEYVFKTDGLNKTYGSFQALNNLKMAVPKGSIYGFVGKNGAGKTTLMRILCGLQMPTTGDFELYGVKGRSSKIHEARRRIGSVVETPALYTDMTAEDNLKLQCQILGLPDYKSIPELLSLVGLENTGKKKVKNFSLGMRQRLGIAVALCGEPDLLVLDEPINGLDPQGIVEIRELIMKLNAERKITVIISSHILDELAKLATYYGFIDKGHIVKEMSADELEGAFRKSIRIRVDHMEGLTKTLESRGLEYKVISETECDIYAMPMITDLALALLEEKCNIISVTEKDESLEGFYLSLVGGGES
ncbi:MAG: ATP-binding cassette domain-containing protein [Lachnospiraceae bacterium]|nr:ATP-binding cassette domain-containing protein [Lachnospiraceae bacterium]